MMITLATKEASAMPALTPATHVSYMGHAATVVHGYDPSDPWLPIPSQRRAPVVNIRLNVPAAGISRQLDVPASSLIRL